MSIDASLIPRLERVAKRQGLIGVGSDGGRYTSALEGVLHELAHVAAIAELLGGDVESNAFELLLESGHDGLTAFDDYMMRYYIAIERLPHPVELIGGAPIWADGEDAAVRRYLAVSDRCEIEAQAATYLVLYRMGLERSARFKFEDSRLGPNRGVPRYVERCCRALRRPQAGRIADAVETMVPRFLAVAELAIALREPRAQAMAGMLWRPPSEIESMVADLQRSGVDPAAALDRIVLDSIS